MDASLARMLFAPRSVAIIGASDDPSKTTSRPLQYLRNNGFSGTIYPVNPRSRTVLGERAFASVEDVPEIPDHAFILLPAEAAIDAVIQCGRRGVKVATILASGFSEFGREGQDREARLREAARAHGVRLIGPSSLGIVNLHHSMVLTANAAFAESGLMRGGIFCASQSGSMIGALLSRGKERGIGFASLVSVGGELDLGIGDLCEAGLEDPHVTSFMLFLENLRNAPALRRFAAKAAAAGKPVTALKLGRSAAAAELAVSHTGALSGEDDVADAFLADCGIARVETLDGLIEAAPLLSRLPIRSAGAARPRVAVVTTTGGGAAMVVDQLGIRGIAVEPPDNPTLAAIRATGIDVAAARIVDLTLAGVRYEIMKGALEALLASSKYDLVIAVVGSSSRFQPELAVRPIIDVANKNTPLAAFMVPDAPQALKMLGEAGIPAFRSPEALGDVVASAFRRRPARGEVPATPANRPGGPVLDEMEGYGLLDLLGVSHARAITVGCGTQVVSDKGLSWPVAVKVLHAHIPHKSDVGGVVLDIRSDQEFAGAARRIVRSVGEKKPDLSVERLLVQEMTAGALGEMLVGYRVDPQAGGMVLLAAGGVMTEIYRDRSLRVAPIDRAAAYEMLDEVKIIEAFRGFRGRPAGDLEALADTLVAVSRMASSGMPVVEFEINPLLVLPTGQGVRAVDVLVRLAPGAEQERP
ncbi:MAG: acetate--CoA ligase family protein [Afipia sp.]|nr:acetate--CoA ligase family protein [Afipia sp.]OJW63997.1 MAG: 6-carboxyhexanoate--CoA ligase [Afipia sp. 64-13]